MKCSLPICIWAHLSHPPIPQNRFDRVIGRRWGVIFTSRSTSLTPTLWERLFDLALICHKQECVVREIQLAEGWGPSSPLRISAGV